jgi:hypothetical protein
MVGAIIPGVEGVTHQSHHCPADKPSRLIPLITPVFLVPFKIRHVEGVKECFAFIYVYLLSTCYGLFVSYAYVFIS